MAKDNLSSGAKSFANDFLALVRVDSPSNIGKLISKGYSVDQQNRRGITPLSTAILSNRYDMCSLLIKKGANVNALTKTGVPPLFLAIINNSIIMKELSMDSNKMKHDYMATLKKNLILSYRVIQLLVKSGANVNQVIKNNHNLFKLQGLTPLSLAAREDNLMVAQLLIKNNVQINLSQGAFFSPLIVAANNGYKDMIKLLIHYGAHVNEKDNKIGFTPIIAVANSNISDGVKYNIVKYFIEKGADVNSEAKSGMTALGAASNRNDIRTVKLLVKSGANVNANLKTGELSGLTPLDYAKLSKSWEVANYLVSHGAK